MGNLLENKRTRKSIKQMSQKMDEKYSQQYQKKDKNPHMLTNSLHPTFSTPKNVFFFRCISAPWALPWQKQKTGNLPSCRAAKGRLRCFYLGGAEGSLLLLFHNQLSCCCFSLFPKKASEVYFFFALVKNSVVVVDHSSRSLFLWVSSSCEELPAGVDAFFGAFNLWIPTKSGRSWILFMWATKKKTFTFRWILVVW